MENERNENALREAISFIELVRKAQRGDKDAMEKVVEIFEPDINTLSRFIKLPREDAFQALATELIEIVLGKVRIYNGCLHVSNIRT